jgi:pimeloyl-ACP methyl ester carboxylesterase
LPSLLPGVFIVVNTIDFRMTTAKTLLVNGFPIVYDVIGEGSPVMLVHGFGEDHTIWQNQVEVLGKHYQVIVPDLPGSGRSAFTGNVSMEAMADVLKIILDELQAPDCIMIGHSMGGYIVLAFAEKYPQMLKSFGLFHSTAYADSEEKITARRRGISFIRENGGAKFQEQSTPNLFSNETKENRSELVKETVEKYTYFQAQPLMAYYEAMIQRPNRTHVLKNFNRPVLFIIGKSDNAIPFEQVMEQCYLPRLADIHILRLSGHLGMLEEAAKANQVLSGFCTLSGAL